MHTNSVTKEIAAPVDDVWVVLDDFGNLQEYAPKNVSCELLEGPETGVGARRETTVSDGFRVVHEIIEYEPKERYIFEFTDIGEYPMKELEIEFTVAELGDERTEVTMTANYTPKWGPIGWVLGKTVMKRKTRAIIEETLDGLEKHVLTGETVGKTASDRGVQS